MGMCTDKSSHQDTHCYTKPYHFPRIQQFYIILGLKSLSNDETSNTFMYIERFIDTGACFVRGQPVQHTQASPCKKKKKKKKKVQYCIKRSFHVHNQHTITPDLCTWDDLNLWKSVDGVRCMEYVRNEAQWGVPFKESVPYCGQLKGIIRHILWSLSKEKKKKKNNINVYFHAVWHQAIVLHKQWLCFRYSIRCFNITIWFLCCSLPQ